MLGCIGPITTPVHESAPVTVPAELLRQLKLKPADQRTDSQTEELEAFCQTREYSKVRLLVEQESCMGNLPTPPRPSCGSDSRIETPKFAVVP